ncbi:hypothetical protein D3C77_361510 [compost metagenome]
MKQFKFENAVAGLMNPQMIMRDLGMAEKTEVDHMSKDGSMQQSLTFNIIKPKDAV